MRMQYIIRIFLYTYTNAYIYSHTFTHLYTHRNINTHILKRRIRLSLTIGIGNASELNAYFYNLIRSQTNLPTDKPTKRSG